MERSFASLAFLVSGIMFSLTLGAWWVQRTVFTPDDTGATAQAILDDPDIRNDLKFLFAGHGAAALETTTQDLGTFLDTYILTTDAGANELADEIGRIHRVVIGEDDDKVIITGEDLIYILRDQRAATVSDITVPVDTIGTFNMSRKVLDWIVLVTAILGLASMLLGVFLRPDRRDVLRGLGEGFIAIAISLMLFGYLVPVHFFAAIDNRTWVALAPQLALANIAYTIGAAIIFGVIGGLLVLRSFATGGSRRQWSTPLSAARYRGDNDRTWS